MPFMSPKACFKAWPSAIPTSSVVWCWSMCKSPLALIVRSMRECRANRSSIWSRKPMPVAIVDAPVPSRSTATSTSVSLVVRFTDALRMTILANSRAFYQGLVRRANVPCICIATRQFLNHAWTEGFQRMQSPENGQSGLWHGTTILTVRKGGVVAVGGDGQVSIGQTIVKANAKKVRRLGKGEVIGGFAGATADAFTLFERLESKLEQYPGQLTRAAVELAKDWRTDRYLRRLEAMMIVADKDVSLVLTGTGDVLEPEAGIVGIGSGGNYALAAARALADGPLDAEAIVRRSLDIAADICVYTNRNVTIETLKGA